jgi:hypothetical protein
MDAFVCTCRFEAANWDPPRFLDETVIWHSESLCIAALPTHCNPYAFVVTHDRSNLTASKIVV